MHGIAKAVRSAYLAAFDLSCKYQVGENRSTVEEYGIASAESLGIVAVANSKIAIHKEHLAQPLCRVYIE